MIYWIRALPLLARLRRFGASGDFVTDELVAAINEGNRARNLLFFYLTDKRSQIPIGKLVRAIREQGLQVKELTLLRGLICENHYFCCGDCLNIIDP